MSSSIAVPSAHADLAAQPPPKRAAPPPGPGDEQTKPPTLAKTAERPREASASRLLGGMLIAMLGSIGFSGKAIIVKLAYRYQVDAVTLIMYRMLVALGPFALIAYWAGRGKAPLSWRDRAATFFLGLTGYYLASFLDFLGLQYISASLERLILYLNPTLVFLLGVLCFGQRASRRQVAAVLVGYAGILVVFGGEIHLAGPHVVRGTLLVFGGAVSYALYIAYSGAMVARIGTMRLVGWASTVACSLCIAQFLLVRPLSAARVPSEVLWLSLINGTACTVAPVSLLMIAIARVGATAAAQASLMGPLSTIAMGALILDEPLTSWVIVGTALVLCSIWMLARR